MIVLITLFLLQVTWIYAVAIVLIGIAVGLGIGWLAWGALLQKLMARFETVGDSLDALTQHSLAQKYGTDGTPEMTIEDWRAEVNRLTQYARQLESDRNRLLSEMKQLQKQIPAEETLAALQSYQDLERERTHLWKELLEDKRLIEMQINDIKQLKAQIIALQQENTDLDGVITVEMQALRQKFLTASDDVERLEADNETLTAQNKTLSEQLTYWQTEYDNERKITTALSQQVSAQLNDTEAYYTESLEEEEA
jgi:chromosome segregation ATPase